MAGRRIALLLIHGMGEPLPFEVTDSFATGLTDAYSLTPAECRAGKRDGSVADTDRNSVQLVHGFTAEDEAHSYVSVNVAGPGEPVPDIDIHEAYWAQRPQGLIKLRALFKWMLLQAFAPLRRWAEQGTILPQIGELRRFLGEVALTLLLPLTIVLFGTAAIWLPAAVVDHGRKVADVLDVDALADNRWLLGLGVVGIAFVVVGVVIGIGAWRLGRLHRTERANVAAARRKHPDWDAEYGLDPDTRLAGIARWRVWSWWALLLAPIGVGLIAVAGINWREVAEQVDPGGRDWLLLGQVAATAAGVLLAKFLVDYMGDVAVYAQGIDGKSQFAGVRQDILDDAVSRLEQLLATPGYDKVYVAAHSLGSVVAYDAINHLITEKRARAATHTPGPNFAKLGGFLSFGSPLDKVYYFFRKRDIGKPVRAQLISSLTPLRKSTSHRRYGAAEFERYQLPAMRNFRWWSAWSGMDILGAHLDFYEPDRQCRFHYGWNPVKAHTGYWRDPSFYRLVRSWLEGTDDCVPPDVDCAG